MHCSPRTLAALVVAGTLLVGTAACSSDSSDDSTATTATTVATTTAADDTPATEATDDAGSADAGTGTVTLADGEADAAHTLTFATDGGWSPATLEVGVGELLTVKAGDDGTYAVAFGESSDTYTVTGGLIETFTIDAAGTYEIREDLSGEMATITVTA